LADPRPDARAALRFAEYTWAILDRDGVLNADRPDYVLTPADWQPLPGAFEGLAHLGRAGVRLAVATNQSAVGRGLLAPAGLARIHARLLDAAWAAGARIEAIAVCPHAPDAGCACRKPAPGLLLRLARCLRFAPSRAVMIGDQPRDRAAAQAAGMSFIGIGPRMAGSPPAYPDLAACVDAWLGSAR
jgi:D-glycero-D-manno-heptose 1,7-bisphosphate phosphatase